MDGILKCSQDKWLLPLCLWLGGGRDNRKRAMRRVEEAPSSAPHHLPSVKWNEGLGLGSLEVDGSSVGKAGSR